ncbi:MAG: 4-hydroxythreonine-4-phosphate dehydrogenase PdxA [Pseudomonadota bacterium]
MTQRTNNHLAPLAISAGEPAGIGPDVILQSWLSLRSEPDCTFYVIGDPAHLADRAKLLGLAVPVVESTTSEALHHFASALPVQPIDGAFRALPGRANPDDAPGVISAIEKGVAAIKAGEASGIVTAPINKEALYKSGFSFPGHTEFLADLAKTHWGNEHHPVMMIAGPQLRTVPVTIHMPLVRVSSVLTPHLIETNIRIVDHDLKTRFGIAEPRIAVSGLNPHAGENGTLGEEDEITIAPVIRQLAGEGLSVRGPVPADTMFHDAARATYDVAVCMYHDQALIPAKALAFDEAVNVTLGLPFIRTSPDHGTAYDLAGTDKASPNSMIAAIRLAARMARQSVTP